MSSPRQAANKKERRRRERREAERAERAAQARQRNVRLAGGGLLAAFVVGAALLAANSGGDRDLSASAASAVIPTGQEIRSLPPPLKANAEQANEIVDDSLDDKLDDLEGVPVVVNQWGSWCPPCRAEFPFFAKAAAAHLDEVAFLGVDIQDDRGDAEEFLAELPTPYPHVFDEDADSITEQLGWRGTSPTTWLITENGEIAHERPGAYANRAELEADLDRYLLEG